jgi:PIN domain nuclease of toxin-antitoxin system
MTILLDTCDFLWFISGDASLSRRTTQAIQDPSNVVFLSVVFLWEITLKHSLGKLPLPDLPERFIPAQREKHGIQSLPLTEDAVKKLSALPLLHRDPFDRMLICQAQEHGMIFASSDPLLKAYPASFL